MFTARRHACNEDSLPVGAQSHGHKLRVRDSHHVPGGHRKVALFSENVFAKRLFPRELHEKDALLLLAWSNRGVDFVDRHHF